MATNRDSRQFGLEMISNAKKMIPKQDMLTTQESRQCMIKMVRNAKRIENELIELAQLIQDPCYQQGMKRCPSTIGLLRKLVTFLEAKVSKVVAEQRFGTRRCRPDLPPLKIPRVGQAAAATTTVGAKRCNHQHADDLVLRINITKFIKRGETATADWCDHQYGEDIANRIKLIKHYICRLATEIESNQHTIRLFQSDTYVERLIYLVERVSRETLFVRDHLLGVTAHWS